MQPWHLGLGSTCHRHLGCHLVHSKTCHLRPPHEKVVLHNRWSLSRGTHLNIRSVTGQAVISIMFLVICTVLFSYNLRWFGNYFEHSKLESQVIVIELLLHSHIGQKVPICASKWSLFTGKRCICSHRKVAFGLTLQGGLWVEAGYIRKTIGISKLWS